MASSAVYFWNESTDEVAWAPPAGAQPRSKRDTDALFAGARAEAGGAAPAAGAEPAAGAAAGASNAAGGPSGAAEASAGVAGAPAAPGAGGSHAPGGAEQLHQACKWRGGSIREPR